MSTTFTWKIANLERTLEDHRVYTVHYTITATSDQNDAEGNPITAGAYGSIGLEGDVSVAFADLTENLVVGWVKDALGGDEKVTEIQTALDNHISEKITPSTSAGVPWGTPE